MSKAIFLLLLPTICNSILTGNITNAQHYSTEDSIKIIEKVYLHVDRDIYSPGDNIWFKGYLIDATDRLLTNHSHNLHVELISQDFKIIDSRIVKLEDGLGNGDLQLPKIMKSGQYSLRAYTNYMRNFGDQLFFIKPITIINSSTSDKVFSDSIILVKKKFEVSFFPEGGSLLDNVPSVIGFKSVNVSGASCDVSGKLFSSTGELITTFKSVHKGMGRFIFTPVLGLDYYAIVKNLAGDEVKSQIPKCFPTGLVLNINRNLTNELGVTVRTNQKTLSLTSDHDFSLTVSAHNIVYKAINFKIKSLNDSLILATDDIPDGIIALTLSDPGHKPLCERLVYIQNNEDLKINLETNKTIYKQRDSVSVKISMSDNYALAPEAYASLSATESTSTYTSSQFPSTISSWFLLESDVHGPVEEPSYYFDISNPDRLKDLDLLLLTQGWRDFEWKYKNMSYLPEYGFNISGRVRKKLVDIPLINSTVTVCLFNNGKPLISAVPTDSSGRFILRGIDLTGDARLIATSTGEKEQLQGWLLLDSSKYVPAGMNDYTGQSKLSLDNNSVDVSLLPKSDQLIKSYIQYTEIKTSINKKYRLTDTINVGEVTIIAKQKDIPGSAAARTRIYLSGAPDKELIMTPDLEKYGTVVKLLGARKTFMAGISLPIFVIDGMKVPFDVFRSFPTNMIDRIDVLNTTASISIFGANTEWVHQQLIPADGVISITTRRDGPLNSNAKVYYTAKAKFSGYNEPRIFYSPKHHSTLEADFKPDLRTTLYWEPNIKLENGKDLILNYYNADNSSTIKLFVEGITTTGIPVTGSIKYKVQ
ncbi:MAG: MG2 domain-containing protein [Bacteroidales bacterium]